MKDILLATGIFFVIAVGFIAVPLVGAFLATLITPVIALVILVFIVKLWREDVTNRKE